MAILYALVSRGRVVLAEYTFTSGNFPTITRVLLGKIGTENTKMSYVYDQHAFHYIVQDGITYLCMTDISQTRRMPFAFLEDMKGRFQSAYGTHAQSAIAFAMNPEFSPVIKRQMDHFNSTPDQLTTVNTKLEDVKNVMVQNIDMVLERGEKLELLVDKTDKLQSQAFKFEKSSRQLKSTMYWRRFKLYSIIFLVVVFALWLLTSLICGFDYSLCRHDER